MIKFSTMNEKEFYSFSTQSMNDYKEDKIKANGFTEKEALQISQDGFKKMLPLGFKTPDNFFFNLIDEVDQNIGHLWYTISGAQDNRKAFIADIFVKEEKRGEGYGKQAMIHLESHVKDQGLEHIGLHVFGFNKAAIGLYNSLGYKTTDLVMEKKI